MFKLSKGLIPCAIVLLAGLASPSWSYDKNLAADVEKLFASAKEGQAGKALHCVKPEFLINKVKKGEPVVGLDIRTPAESAVFTVVLPGSMSIPLNELFLPANLDRIPMDRPIVVLCQSGIRAGMAVTALRQVGFEQAFVLQGGYKALSEYLDPVTAYSPVTTPGPGK